MKRVLLSLIVFSFFVIQLSAQENSEFEVRENKNQINFVIGYTHIPSAFEDGKEEGPVFVLTIGIDYFRELNEKWVLGFVMDLELGDYSLDFNDDQLDRENAFLVGIIAGYELSEHWGVMAGPAIEFEGNKDLFVFRLTTEYKIDLGESWLLLPSFNYDFKEEYSSWNLSVGVGKKF
ncbi:porin family protein [Tamlana agarivorans]|uniref:Porin family protein n=1 Tax=Pseudotamlana agarivorans TaxID=481183 RepID=A0ACC5U4A2_9FLAO|nr:porin family protein [Tamlana agarivorans]MBU2949137.1 porin family protein [Tamlana agarivorans]